MSTSGNHTSGPLIIGGVGGSGTRVVAAVLREVGVHLGGYLNDAFDNLWFTALLKRPAWVQAQRRTGGEEVRVLLALLGRAIALGLPDGLSARESVLVAEARADIAAGRAGSGAAAAALDTLERAPACMHEHWGWKEPNSHIFLEELADVFPSARYLHLVRHGLDMAYSSNTQQLMNWGNLFGMAPVRNGGVPPEELFQYWARSNETAVCLAQERFGARLLVVRFEALCQEREATIARILEWAGLSVEPARLSELARIPEPRASIGRHQSHPLWRLSRQDAEILERFGFSVPERARP